MSGIIAAIGLLVATVGATAMGAVPAAAAGTCAGVSPDFNGDGLVDIVVTDPQATVNGVPQAGLVRVLYAGGKGVSEISQATPGMGVTPERGDQFGTAVAWTDFNGDGCTDLVIGTPYEDTGGTGSDVKDAISCTSSTARPPVSARVRSLRPTPRRRSPRGRATRQVTASVTHSRQVRPTRACRTSSSAFRARG